MILHQEKSSKLKIKIRDVIRDLTLRKKPPKEIRDIIRELTSSSYPQDILMTGSPPLRHLVVLCNILPRGPWDHWTTTTWRRSGMASHIELLIQQL